MTDWRDEIFEADGKEETLQVLFRMMEELQEQSGWSRGVHPSSPEFEEPSIEYCISYGKYVSAQDAKITVMQALNRHRMDKNSGSEDT